LSRFASDSLELYLVIRRQGTPAGPETSGFGTGLESATGMKKEDNF
jgi:hypothetical protein